jgi:rhodanese-related sulfurtransferase
MRTEHIHAGGARTDEATRFLRALGFVDVRHVQGGMSAWAQVCMLAEGEEKDSERARK